MKESCCQIGGQRQLAGIITEPVGARRSVGCVLVSAGLVPKAGPYRLYVQWARRLSRDGFVTLRFDLGGLGDSLTAHTGETLGARTLVEIRAAADLLGNHGLKGVVVGGLCSGAEDAFRYAERDDRVAGAVLVDPFCYETPGWRWRDYWSRLERRSWRALGAYHPIRPPASGSASGSAAGAFRTAPLVTYRYMDRAESSRILKTLVGRGANVHFVYTGGARGFNHRGQLEAMFEDIDFEGRVTLDHFPRTDHTQMLEEDRLRLVEAIARRLAAAY